MKFIPVFFIFLLLVSCSRTINESRIVKSYPQQLAFDDTTDMPKLKFDTIGKFEFEASRKTSHKRIYGNSQAILRTDTSFYVFTKDSIFCFPADTTDYGKFAYWEEYYPELKAHAVTYVDGDNEIGELLLVDRKTNAAYEIPSAFDDPCLPPLLSKHHNFLAAYANDGYSDNGASIAIVYVNRKSSGEKFRTVLFYTTDQWKIKELIWLPDDSFVLDVITTTVNEETGEASTAENYLAADIK